MSVGTSVAIRFSSGAAATRILKNKNAPTSGVSNLVPLPEWLAGMGLSRTTGWRLVRRGWLQIIKIGKRNYVHIDELRRFESLARKGEFDSVASEQARRHAATEVKLGSDGFSAEIGIPNTKSVKIT